MRLPLVPLHSVLLAADVRALVTVQSVREWVLEMTILRVRPASRSVINANHDPVNPADIVTILDL